MHDKNGPLRDDPLAHFLTWTTYGTWLPGDQRGWVERPGDIREPDPRREAIARERLTEPPMHLTSAQRQIVEQTIRAHCEIRGWHLHAVSCRTNHVHVVVTADASPDDVMNQFKSWCTRKLKEAALMIKREKWWTQRGSKRHINNLNGLESAVQYVVEGQEMAR